MELLNKSSVNDLQKNSANEDRTFELRHNGKLIVVLTFSEKVTILFVKARKSFDFVISQTVKS